MPTFAGRETNNRRTIRVMEGLTALHALYVRSRNDDPNSENLDRDTTLFHSSGMHRNLDVV